MSKPFLPHSYQRYSIQRMLEQPSIGLLLDTGLGKTVITLAALEELLYNRFEVNKPLVVAPKRVAEYQWSEEARKWQETEYLTISKIMGNRRERIWAAKRKADLYVTNVDVLVWLVEYYGAKFPFDMVILDESSLFKNPKSARFRALKKVRPLIHRLVELTATPAPNGLKDLWAQIYLLDQGERLGKTEEEYRARFFEGKDNPKTEEIYRAISDIVVSLRAEDWLELPPRIDRVVNVHLPKEAMDKYEQFERDLLLPCDKSEIAATDARSLMTKLLQFANGAVYDKQRKVQALHDAKLNALEDLVEAANGNPVLVFFSFQHDRDRIMKRFPQARVIDNNQDIEDWNKGLMPIGLLHPASGGHGLNLQQGGSIVVWYSMTWNLEHYIQGNGRIYRQGQQNTVIVHHLIARGTIDEDVMQVLSDKNADQNDLLEAVKARIRRVRKNP